MTMLLCRSKAALVSTMAAALVLGLAVAACEGADGDKGDPGTPCWDLNENGQCDLATEDQTGDSQCNVLDCGGKGDPGDPGQPGTSCWDLNGNGTCDPAEDVNGDTTCTAQDCVGVSSGALEGKVTNKLTNAGLAGVSITITPTSGAPTTTAADGSYSVSLPIGSYSVTYALENFKAADAITIQVAAGAVVTQNVVLEPTAPVVVNAGDDQTATVGATLPLAGTVDALDGSTISSRVWSQTGGVPATLTDNGDGTASVVLGDLAAYKVALFANLKALERFDVQGVNPYSLELAKAATFQFTATTSSGTYQASVVIEAELPWTTSSGLRNVPIGVPVLLHGKTQGTYAWAVTAPGGGAITLDEPAGQNPAFTPDAAGTYTVTEATGAASFGVVAGTWAGAITGQDADGQPLSAGCTGCHNGGMAPDKFTAWKKTGHGEAFSSLLQTGSYFRDSCLGCHTVGFDPAASNGGFDDASDYAAFKASGLMGKADPTGWTTMLAQYPDTARLANVQCDSCHGPNNSGLHQSGARSTLNADLCGSCHGEPERHARFQQWELSSHANYESAEAEGTVEAQPTNANNCGRCHSGQGFLAYIAQGDLTKPIQGAAGNATVAELTALGMTTDQVHPITCAVCHDPHAEGSASGEPNTATVRITDSTPMLPAGFAAIGVGRGAICFVCHNARAGAHNDWVGDPTGFGTPHGSAQGDVLMGENAYFVGVGNRSPHSYINDSCANCHMVQTPPPEDLSYHLGGTNHSFAASNSICANCHGSFDASGLQTAVQENLELVHARIGQAVVTKANGLGSIKVRALDKATRLYSSASSSTANVTVDTATNPLLSASLAEWRGQMEMDLVLTTPIQITWTDSSVTTTASFGVELRSLFDATDVLVYALTGNLVRAGWNYFLLEADKSDGIHNPDFATQVITTSLRADLSQ